MELRQVRPGLYERVDTPKHVKLNREFAQRLAEAAACPALLAIVDEAIREQEAREEAPPAKRPRWRLW